MSASNKIKIGILTFHSQINYGGVLQAYALQEVIKEMGYDAVMLDRWLNPDNSSLLGPYTDPFPRRLRYYAYSITGCGWLSCLKRHKNTMNFIKKNLNLSSLHFMEWKEIRSAEQLGVDGLVIGSDQVWHSSFHNIEQFYLLSGAPRIPAVAYAASIGMTAIPDQDRKAFEQIADRFQAVSVREKEAAQLLSFVPCPIAHVADPTMLVPPEFWRNYAGKTESQEKPSKRIMFCYFIAGTVFDYEDFLVECSKEKNQETHVFFVKPLTISFPCSPSKIKTWMRFQKLKMLSRVHLHFSAGPDEFLKYASMATDAVTDSFHALMFSVIFKLNVRVLAPGKERKEMFARIREFEKNVVQGRLVANDLSDALQSILHEEKIIFDESKIQDLRKYSENWLKNALSATGK